MLSSPKEAKTVQVLPLSLARYRRGIKAFLLSVFLVVSFGEVVLCNLLLFEKGAT